MKKLIYLLTILFFFSCGSKNKSAQVFNEILKDIENEKSEYSDVFENALDRYFYANQIISDVDNFMDRAIWERGLRIQNKMSQTIDRIKNVKITLSEVKEIHEDYENLLLEEHRKWKDSKYIRLLNLPKSLKSNVIPKKLSIDAYKQYIINDIYFDTYLLFEYLNISANRDLESRVNNPWSWSDNIFNLHRIIIEEGDSVELEIGHLSKLSGYYHSRIIADTTIHRGYSSENISSERKSIVPNIHRTRSNGFYFYIPTTKLGKQTWEMDVQIHNFLMGSDTIIHLSKTFEVIP